MEYQVEQYFLSATLSVKSLILQKQQNVIIQKSNVEHDIIKTSY